MGEGKPYHCSFTKIQTALNFPSTSTYQIAIKNCLLTTFYQLHSLSNEANQSACYTITTPCNLFSVTITAAQDKESDQLFLFCAPNFIPLPSLRKSHWQFVTEFYCSHSCLRISVHFIKFVDNGIPLNTTNNKCWSFPSIWFTITTFLFI